MEALLTELNLDNPNYSVLIDKYRGSSSLLVSFGGIANALPIPVFEFMRSLDRFMINKVFIRDFNQCWYTNGIQGITNTPLDTAAYLKRLVGKFGTKKTVFMGNSAGGYAAMLYGQILNVSEVHAFSPQTFIDPLHRMLFWDRRWPKEISNLSGSHRSFFDLKKIFNKYRTHSTRHHIYWDRRHRLDNIHARRMRGDHFTHHSYDMGQHAVIRHLRDSGELDVLLEKALFNNMKGEG